MTKFVLSKNFWITKSTSALLIDLILFANENGSFGSSPYKYGIDILELIAAFL